MHNKTETPKHTQTSQEQKWFINNNNDICTTVFNNDKLKEFNNKSVEYIMKDQIEHAIEILKTVEVYLESNIIETTTHVDKKMLIIVLHNIACCYQKVKDFDSCIAYLDAVIFHFDNILQCKHNVILNEEYFVKSILTCNNSEMQLKGDLILELRFSAKFHLQMCAVLSQANKHVSALTHAKLAMLMCEDNLTRSFHLYNHIYNSNNSSNKDKNDITLNKASQSIIVLKELYNKILSLRMNNNSNNSSNNCSQHVYKKYTSYNKYRKSEINNNLKKNILIKNVRNVFGESVNKDDWIQLLNIGNIMYLSALNYEDLDLDTDPKYELLRDAILEKLVMLTVAYFCIATELRFISNNSSNNSCNDKTNGKFYHSKAIEFASLFLPVSCPIVKHYIFSYYKHYGNDMDVIKEGEVSNNKIELLRSEIEIDKDVLTFITTKRIHYTYKPIINVDNTNNTNNNNNTTSYDVIPNNNVLATKSKIKEEKAPKFKLNFMNINTLISGTNPNYIHNNNNNNNSVNNSTTFINHSTFKEDSVVINNNNNNISHIITKEYIPNKTNNKLNSSHQSNSMNNSKLYTERAFIKHKSKTERIKITKMYYVNKHPPIHNNSKNSNSNSNSNSKAMKDKTNSNNVSYSKHKKTERAKSSGRVKSTSNYESSSKEKYRTQRGFGYGNSKSNIYSKSKPNSKMTSNSKSNNVNNKSQTFNMKCYVDNNNNNNKKGNRTANGKHEYNGSNSSLIEKIFSNRLKKTTKDINGCSSSNTSFNSLIMALGVKMKHK